MDLTVILLILSGPVFYVWGLVACILWLSRLGQKGQASAPQPINRQMMVGQMIAELGRQVGASPDLRVSEEIEQLRRELGPNSLGLGQSARLPLATPIVSPEVTSQMAVTGSAPLASPVARAQQNDWWSGWYEENSINLLLYVGAFLILASASIFVGFQWGAIPGEIKAMLLTLVMAAFGGSGLVFYRMPKIRQAGAVFAAIGALLVPLAGMAWYVFVLRDYGVTLGWAWFMTGLVTLVAQAGMVVAMRQEFYGYTASLSGVAVALAFVPVFGLPQETFVAAGMMGCVALLVGFWRGPVEERWRQLALRPMRLTSQVVMPALLVYGLGLTISDGTFLTFTTSGSALLAVGYYFISYALDKRPWQLLVGLGLAPVAGIALQGAWSWPEGMAMHVLAGFGLAWLMLAEGLRRLRLAMEWQGAVVIGVFLYGIALLISFSQSPEQQLVMAGLATMAVLLAGMVSRRVELGYGVFALLALTCFDWLGRVWGQPSWMSYLAGCYWLIGMGCFVISLAAKRYQAWLAFGTSGVVGYLFLAVVLAFDQPWLMVAIAASVVGMSVVAAKWFKQADLVFLSGVSAYGLLLAWLWALRIPDSAYPLSLVGVAYAEYLLSWLVEAEAAKRLRATALGGAVVIPVFYFLRQMNVWEVDEALMRPLSLASAYAGTLLLGLHAAVGKKPPYGYGASVMGVFTYVWQLQVLGVTEVQWFAVPIGGYCLALSWLRGQAKDEANAGWLEALGLLLIVGVTTVQAFGGDSVVYSLLLMGYGVALLGAGVSLEQKSYRYTGLTALVLGVIARTYSFLFMLPKWAIVGLLGLVFLGVAMWLMVKREGVKGRKP